MAKAKERPGDLVALKHSKFKEARPVVTRRAFENVWKGKGYTLDDTVEPAATSTTTEGSAS